MRPIDNANRNRPVPPARFRLTCLIVLTALGPGCSSLLRPTDGVPAVPADPPSARNPTPATTRGEFTIPASMLDTWNAVGQILVRTDGVIYESRAQMLGIYAVRYRGEPLLIVTRARVMQDPGDGMLTHVRAIRQDGEPHRSTAAADLLELLQQRLPEELARIAAGER